MLLFRADAALRGAAFFAGLRFAPARLAAVFFPPRRLAARAGGRRRLVAFFEDRLADDFFDRFLAAIRFLLFERVRGRVI